MPGPTANRNPNVVDIGPGLLLVAPIGTAEPTDIVDSAWPAAWIELGYTDKGSIFKVEPTVDDVMVAEERDPVQQIVSKVKSTLSIEMAQITAWNFGVAMGGGTIVTAAGVTTFEPPDHGTERELMVGWRSAAKDEAMLWRRCKPDGALNLERTPGSTKALIPAVFTVLVPAGKKVWKWFGADPARTGQALATVFP